MGGPPPRGRLQLRPAAAALRLAATASIARSLNQSITNHTTIPMATHFGMNGQPNGWMSRSVATLFQCVLQAVMPFVFIGIAWTLPRFPNSMINLPNKEYWLAPERRAATLGHMTNMLMGISLAVSIFIAVIAHLVFDANRRNEPLPTTPFVVLLILFLATVFSITGYSIWTLRLPRRASG
jgi:serine/threonine-protein kinase